MRAVFLHPPKVEEGNAWKHQFYHGAVPRIKFTFVAKTISTSSEKHAVRRANSF
jgi:hypothetical protein